MAQSYLPIRQKVASPRVPSPTFEAGEKLFNQEDMQEAFIKQKERYVYVSVAYT